MAHVGKRTAKYTRERVGICPGIGIGDCTGEYMGTFGG